MSYFGSKTYQLLIILFIVIGPLSVCDGQNTVGLVSYTPDKSYEGYTLIYPHNQPHVYLLNNCGEAVHTWPDSSHYVPGNTAYILPNGNLVKAKRNRDVTGDKIWAGGGGEYVEIRNWENDLLWQYSINNDTQRLHHDIEVLPNGNILLVMWDLKTLEEAINAGRDTMLIPQGEIWSESILEIDPSSNSIIWKWEVWDHLVQDFDPSKENYGAINDHPRKININRVINGGSADWLHINSIDYHPNLDQIVVSVPYLDEAWIIDHSTTTAQAKTSVGGVSNYGGDFLYRIGNNFNFSQGNSDDQILFFQHDVHWALDFLSRAHPDYGKLVAFNNQVGMDFSSVEKWETGWDMYSVDYVMDNSIWLPEEFTNTLTHPERQKVYSTGLSSAQILPNRNTLVCSGRSGYIVEITESNEVVWEYKVPLNRGQRANQGDTLLINQNLTFRADRYPLDYKAFEGRDFSDSYYLESNPDTALCDRIVSVIFHQNVDLSLQPNPASSVLRIQWRGMMDMSYQVTNVAGKMCLDGSLQGGQSYLDVSMLPKGIYFFRTTTNQSWKFVKI